MVCFRKINIQKKILIVMSKIGNVQIILSSHLEIFSISLATLML